MSLLEGHRGHLGSSVNLGGVVFEICFERDVSVQSRCIEKLVSSWDFMYFNTKVDGAMRISSMKVKDKKSDSKCVEKDSFGFVHNQVWVDKGCRAVFDICYEGSDNMCEDIELKCGLDHVVEKAQSVTCMKIKKDYMNDACWTLNKPEFGFKGNKIYAGSKCHALFTVCYKPYPLAVPSCPAKETQTKCIEKQVNSWEYKYKIVAVDGADVVTSMRIYKKHSDSHCTLHKSYGFKGNNLWVNHGCRATFTICYNRDLRSKCIEKPVDSWGYKYYKTNVDGAQKIHSMTLVTKRSKADCKVKDSFGFDNDGQVWVDKGCRATFSICYDGGEDNCMTKDVKGGAKATIIDKARVITCITINKEYTVGKCHKQGKKLYHYQGRQIWTSKGCDAELKVCYRPFPRVEPECPAPEPEKKSKCIQQQVDSWSYAFFERAIDSAEKVNSMKLVTRHSTAKCIWGHSYGVKHDKVWVHRGCRGIFEVCYDREMIDDKCIDVDVSSWKYKFFLKKIEGAENLRSMTLKKRVSNSACTYKETFGHTDREVWVDEGCRGIFTVCYGEGVPKGECEDVAISGGAAKKRIVKAEAITCMKIKKEKSEDKCWKMGKPAYYFDRLNVWAEKGCDATFKVCYKPATTCPAPGPKQVCEKVQLTGGVDALELVKAKQISCMKLTKENSACWDDKKPKFYFQKNRVWTLKGCNAEFTTCYTPCTFKQKPIFFFRKQIATSFLLKSQS
jgi:hypothetical protein